MIGIYYKLKGQYKGEILYTSSNFLTSAVALISNVIAVAYIIPEEMGIYQSILLIGTYAGFLHLGVFNGLNRNIAFYKAQNRHDIVQAQVNAAHSVAIIVSFVGILIGIIFLAYTIFSGESQIYYFASLLLMISLALTPYKSQMETTYRSGQEFKALGQIIYKENIVYLLMSLLPIFIGYLGKIISDSIRLIYGVWLRWKSRPIKATAAGTTPNFIDLVKTGFPLLLGGYLWSIFIVADQTLIALKFSAFDLGVYTLSRLIIMALMIIPGALNALLYPKAAALFGRTGDASTLRSFWKKSLLLFILMIVPSVILASFLLPMLVDRFMPNYVLGLPSAMINLITGLTFISMGPSVIFGTLKKNIYFILAIIIVLMLFWGIYYAIPHRFSTIESVAWLKLILSSGFSVFILICTYNLTRKNA